MGSLKYTTLKLDHIKSKKKSTPLSNWITSRAKKKNQKKKTTLVEFSHSCALDATMVCNDLPDEVILPQLLRDISRLFQKKFNSYLSSKSLSQCGIYSVQHLCGVGLANGYGMMIFMSADIMASLCGVGIRVCVNDFSSETTRPRDMMFF